MLENAVGKGEIASYEQFLLFPTCFQKTSTADPKKPGLVWERVNSTPKYKMLEWAKSKAFAINYSFLAQTILWDGVA